MEKNRQKKDALAYVEAINKSIRNTGGLGKVAFIVAALVAVACVAISLMYVNDQAQQVYVVRQGSMQEASAGDRYQFRDKEVYYHVLRFHEKFYNLSPNMETINENINEALGMADNSVVMLDNRRREQQFYANLVKLLAVEEIRMDSLKVDVSVYPYKAHYYGRLYVIRETKLSEYPFESSCQLINTPASSSNLSGLRIERYVENRGDVTRSGTRR